MTVHPDKFADQIELHRYAERNGLAYAWEYTRAFARWQELLTPEQYELVELRTSQGTSRAMFFLKAMQVEQKVAIERERWRAIQTKPAGSAHASKRAG
jgi:hypothetical protein